MKNSTQQDVAMWYLIIKVWQINVVIGFRAELRVLLQKQSVVQCVLPAWSRFTSNQVPDRI